MSPQPTNLKNLIQLLCCCCCCFPKLVKIGRHITKADKMVEEELSRVLGFDDDSSSAVQLGNLILYLLFLLPAVDVDAHVLFDVIGVVDYHLRVEHPFVL